MPSFMYNIDIQSLLVTTVHIMPHSWLEKINKMHSWNVLDKNILEIWKIAYIGESCYKTINHQKLLSQCLKCKYLKWDMHSCLFYFAYNILW